MENTYDQKLAALIACGLEPSEAEIYIDDHEPYGSDQAPDQEPASDQFVASYIETALWSSMDDQGEPLDATYGAEDIAPETLATMRADCDDFVRSNRADLEGIEDAQAGHDFWLTRNRHGAGFWDRGLGDVGSRLTEASHPYGSFDLMECSDGLLRA